MSTSTKSASKLFVPLAIAGALIAATAVGAAEAKTKNGARHGAAMCGVHSYRHDGKCVDARAKDGKTWMEKALAKPAWN